MSALPEVMKGVHLTGHGGFECLDYREDIPVPKPGNGEVLIRVSAAGVNNTDINTRLAWYSKGEGESDDAGWFGGAIRFPRIQGADACGRIVAVGEGVDVGRIGERVLVEPCLYEAAQQQLDAPWYFGSECDGAFADYTLVASRHAHRINSALSDEDLASFPCSYSTAENLLTRAQVAPGDRVLITGASGGVGSAAIQLAKARGAHVTAITSASKFDAIRDAGADEVLDRSKDLFAQTERESMDVVIDLVAG